MKKKLRALCAVFVCMLASCGSGKQNAETAKPAANNLPPGYAVPPEGLVLYAGAKAGLQNKPFALAHYAACIESVEDGALMAVNREGLVSLRIAHDDGLRLVTETVSGDISSAFIGRTLVSSWNSGDKAYFLLTRHPVFETAPQAGPQSLVIESSMSEARIFTPGIGDTAYAVFPRKPDALYAQYRTETDEKVSSDYAVVSGNGLVRRTIDRGAFEKAVLPLPLSDAPEPLRKIAERMAGSIVIEAAMPDRSRQSFFRGDIGSAAQVWAHVHGYSVLLVSDDWRILVSKHDDIRELQAFPPHAGAVVRGAVLCGNAALLIWEQGSFPNISMSGLMALEVWR